MASRYEQAMNALSLSEGERARMAAALEERAGAAGGARLEMVEGGAQTVRGEVRRARPRLRLAAAAAVVAALVLGGVAHASGALVSVERAIAGIFAGPAASTEVVDKIGHPIDASARSGGIIMTADAVIGDATSYTVVYSLVREDGRPFELPVGELEDGILPLGFERSDSMVDSLGTGLSGMGGSSWFYDADPDDPAIQYVEQMSVHADRSVAGKTLTCDATNLVAYPADGEPVLIAEGSWRLRFELGYEDSTVGLPAGQTFDLNGMKATIDELGVSPVSLHIAYTADERMASLADGGALVGEDDYEAAAETEGDQDGALTLEVDDASAAGRMSEAEVAEAERFMDIGCVTLRFADGSTIAVPDMGGGSATTDGVTSVDKTLVFSRIINVDELVAIEIGGVTIELR